MTRRDEKDEGDEGQALSGVGDQCIRILTLNCHGHAHRRDLGVLVEFLRDCRADVIALQEVMRYPGFSQHDAISLALAKAGLTHAAYTDTHRRLTRAQGNAMYSRWPLSEQASVVLPRDWRGERRRFLHARLGAPIGAMRVGCTHLTDVLAEPRLRQALAMDGALGHTGPPTFLCGDLNATPSDAPVRDLISLGWTDCWSMVNGPAGGATSTPPLPTRRIDYVLATGLGDWRIMRADVLGDERVSDHLGLLVTVTTAASSTAHDHR